MLLGSACSRQVPQLLLSKPVQWHHRTKITCLVLVWRPLTSTSLLLPNYVALPHPNLLLCAVQVLVEKLTTCKSAYLGALYSQPPLIVVLLLFRLAPSPHNFQFLLWLDSPWALLQMPLLGLDIARYKSVRPFSHYGELDVLDTGSVTASRGLPEDIASLLREIGANFALWDGTKGVLGRDYVTNKASTSPLKGRERQRFLDRYVNLRNRLPSPTELDKLHVNLEIQMRTQRQVNSSVYEIERELEQLKKARDNCKLEHGEGPRLEELTRQIERLESDRTLSKISADKINTKVKETRLHLSEGETGHLRRLAMLRCLVGGMSKEESINNRSKGEMNEYRRVAREADDKSGRACLDYLQTKRVYIDAKTGLVHLYNLEGMLKGILQHLELSTRGSQSSIGESASPSTDYRMGYVHKQWSLAQSNFRTMLPFLKNTSLISARGIAEEQSNEFRRNETTDGRSGARDVSVFDNVPRLLPSSIRIGFCYMFNPRSRIAHLHRSAAKAYREINLLYDCHERTVKEAFEVLQEKEAENRRAHDDLISKWEDLLGIQCL